MQHDTVVFVSGSLIAYNEMLVINYTFNLLGSFAFFRDVGPADQAREARSRGKASVFEWMRCRWIGSTPVEAKKQPRDWETRMYGYARKWKIWETSHVNLDHELGRRYYAPRVGRPLDFRFIRAI